MESSKVWSGLDAALHEFGMLCGDESRRGHARDKLEKSRHLNNLVSGTNTSKCHYRHLLPSQSWNRPGILSEVEGDGVPSNSGKNIFKASNGENTENSFSLKTCKLVKISEPKGGVALGNSKSYSLCHSEGITENEGLNVLRMNSHYITGVTIGTFGSSRNGPNKGEPYVKPGTSHNTPKYGLSMPSLRHHHVRPYEIPWRREERVRTTSETAENEAGTPMDNADVPFNYLVVGNGRKINTEKLWGSLLKSRSLENVRIAENEVLQVPAHEMDSMSKRIQHLHVDE